MTKFKLWDIKPKRRPTIDEFADDLVAGFARFHARNEEHWDAIVQSREDLPGEKRRRLVGAFRRAARDLDALADKLEQKGVMNDAG